uniref:Uncharacterized protein n=1 Tax=viral metagenome TaxID=1070528 RepID=A0A6M3IRF6_9ZZZZ
MLTYPERIRLLSYLEAKRWVHSNFAKKVAFLISVIGITDNKGFGRIDQGSRSPFFSGFYFAPLTRSDPN